MSERTFCFEGEMAVLNKLFCFKLNVVYSGTYLQPKNSDPLGPIGF